MTRANGDVTDTYTYDAFGILTDVDDLGTPTVNHYRYAGEQWDAELGMYYLRARYYHPDVDRFWSMDTFEGTQSDPLSLHKYLYAHANPVNGVDPSGHEFNLIGQLAVIAINAWTGVKIAYTVHNAYSRTKHILSLVQDLAFVIEAIADDDPENDGIVLEMLQNYLKGAIRAAAIGIAVTTTIGIVAGAGGRVAGRVAFKMGKAGILKGGIKKAQDFYKEHKRIWANRHKDVDLNGKTVRVHYDQNGWLKLDEFLVKVGGRLKKNPVTIKLTGKRKGKDGDFAAADAAAGIDEAYRDAKNLVWHHHQQLGKMMLVPRAVHNPGSGGPKHDGAIAIVKRVWGGYDD